MNILESPAKTTSLPKFSFIYIMLKGRTALQNVTGLQKAIWKIFLFNYAIFGLLLIALNGSLYFWVLQPFISWIFGNEGGVAWVGSILLWIVQFTISAIFAVVALRLSIVLMSMWYENLVTLIIKHFRSIPEPPFSVLVWLKTLGKTLRENLRQIFLLLLLFLVGFLPGIGVVFMFFLGAYLIGKDIMLPYFNVLEEHQISCELPKKPSLFFAFILGVSQMFLALIPFVGWVLMPLVMIYQVIGFAYFLEEAQKPVQSS